MPHDPLGHFVGLPDKQRAVRSALGIEALAGNGTPAPFLGDAADGLGVAGEVFVASLLARRLRRSRPSREAPARPRGRTTGVSRRPPAIWAADSAPVAGRRPVPSGPAGIARSSGRARCLGSSRADRACLRTARRSLAAIDRTGGTRRRTSRVRRPFPRDPGTANPVWRTPETPAPGPRRSG